MAPFMEVDVSSLLVNHHMMYDHDILSAELVTPILNDLSMWPKSLNP